MPLSDVQALGAQTRLDPGIQASLDRVGGVFRWCVVAYTVLIGIALALGWEGLTRPELVPSPPEITAAATGGLFVLSLGQALAGMTLLPARRVMAWRRWGMAVCALMASLGASILILHLVGMADEAWVDSLGMPATNTSLAVLLLGASVPMTLARRESLVVLGQIVGLFVLVVTSVVLVAYAYGDTSVGALFTGPRVSLQGALIALLASVGSLLLRPGSGMLSAVASPGPGGRFLRRFGLLVLITPATLLLVAESVSAADRVDVLAWIAVGLGMTLLVFLAMGMRALDEAAVAASAAAAEAERADHALEQEAPLVARLRHNLHQLEVEGIKGWEVATRFRPAQGVVAGDTSAVRVLPDGALGVVLVDVTGHGVDPALWAIRLRDLLAHSLAHNRSPAAALLEVVGSSGSPDLASAVVARIDTGSGKAAIASAGHPPAFVVTEEGTTLVWPTGPLLFLDVDVGYEDEVAHIAPGDAVVFVSDGVTDVQKERGGKSEPVVLGEELVDEAGDASRIAHLVLAFADPRPSDDQTVVVIRRTL